MDQALQIAALATRFRQKLADSSLSLSTLKEYADAALAAMLARTEVMSMTLEGGSGSAVLTTSPEVILAAATEVIEEQGADSVSGGVTHLGLQYSRIET